MRIVVVELVAMATMMLTVMTTTMTTMLTCLSTDTLSRLLFPKAQFF